MLAIVARSASGRTVEPVAVEFDELAHHALLAQHLHDLQHEVGAGRAFDHLAGQLEADDFRDQHGDRLTQHRGLGLDPADAPAEDAAPLTMVVWLSVPTSVSG
jgi:hypothetical protein